MVQLGLGTRSLGISSFVRVAKNAIGQPLLVADRIEQISVGRHSILFDSQEPVDPRLDQQYLILTPSSGTADRPSYRPSVRH
jgi:hypothetical protein